MEARQQHGIITVTFGIFGIAFLLYQGTPVLSLQDIGGYGYAPAIAGYAFFTFVLGFGILMLLGFWSEEWVQDQSEQDPE